MSLLEFQGLGLLCQWIPVRRACPFFVLSFLYVPVYAGHVKETTGTRRLSNLQCATDLVLQSVLGMIA